MARGIARPWLCALGLLGTVLAAQVPGSARAENYPERPVRLIVGNAPGGGTDVAARLIAQKLSGIWAQPVVVENRPGASGTIGADQVAKAAADGYTLLLSPQTSTAIAANMNRQLPYDVMNDFTHLSVIASVPTVLVVGEGSRFKTFEEFAAHARANPEALNFGSGGVGSTQHLAGEMLNLALGTRMQHVPYQGENPAVSDLLNGQLSAMFMTLSTAAPHLQSGRMRALAIASLQRADSAPDIPTIDESGVPGFEMSPWYGLFGPRGVPPEVSQRIHASVRQVLQQEDVRERFARLGFVLQGSSPEEAASHMQDEIRKYARLVEAANINVQ